MNTNNTNNTNIINTIKSINIISSKIKKISYKLKLVNDKNLITPHFRKYYKHNFKKTKYAYATMVILSEDYIPGALTLAYSLRKNNNNNNIICLVQDKPVYKYINNVKTYFKGVNRNTIEDLLKIFDVVYGIDLLQIVINKNDRHFTTKFKHYSNISLYPTKAQVFGLIEYSKILYLDASTLVNKNIDNFFEIYDNSYLDDKWVKETGMGINGSIYIFNPSKYFYTKILYLIYYYNDVFNNLFFSRGIDEIIIYFTIYPDWSNKLIELKKNCTEMYLGKKCMIYHYQIYKPFKKNMNTKEKEYSFRVWDKYTKELLNKYPFFLKYYEIIKTLRKVNYIKS